MYHAITYQILRTVFILALGAHVTCASISSQTIYCDSTAKIKLEGVFINMNSLQAEKNVAVVIQNRNSGEVDTLLTNGDGQFFYELDTAAVYMVSGTKSRFFDAKPVTISTVSYTSDAPFQLQIPIKRMEMNVLYRINVDFPINGHQLYSEMTSELEYVLRYVLKRNPNLTIEIGVHTDSRGDDHYNQELSQKRANAIVDYFTYNGIDKGRVVAKGYGESRILNDCVNGIKCSSQLHSQNRRVEFRILQFE